MDPFAESLQFLCPSLARMFWQDDGLVVFILPGARGLQSYATHQDEAVILFMGRSCRCMKTLKKSPKNKKKRVSFNHLNYNLKQVFILFHLISFYSGFQGANKHKDLGFPEPL